MGIRSDKASRSVAVRIGQWMEVARGSLRIIAWSVSQWLGWMLAMGSAALDLDVRSVFPALYVEWAAGRGRNDGQFGLLSGGRVRHSSEAEDALVRAGLRSGLTSRPTFKPRELFDLGKKKAACHPGKVISPETSGSQPSLAGCGHSCPTPDEGLLFPWPDLPPWLKF
jgi:hypothetical protein